MLYLERYLLHFFTCLFFLRTRTNWTLVLWDFEIFKLFTAINLESQTCLELVCILTQIKTTENNLIFCVFYGKWSGWNRTRWLRLRPCKGKGGSGSYPVWLCHQVITMENSLVVVKQTQGSAHLLRGVFVKTSKAFARHIVLSIVVLERKALFCWLKITFWLHVHAAPYGNRLNLKHWILIGHFKFLCSIWLRVPRLRDFVVRNLQL